MRTWPSAHRPAARRPRRHFIRGVCRLNIYSTGSEVLRSICPWQRKIGSDGYCTQPQVRGLKPLQLPTAAWPAASGGNGPRQGRGGQGAAGPGLAVLLEQHKRNIDMHHAHPLNRSLLS